ncbi:unnamed protein product, partial [Mesorhabditis belari]|uniref:Uncharacterized protein n=1 Tax=Mesorhabditis belari TaxID=2138241 RepID=A0AAF3EBK0_9BILA
MNRVIELKKLLNGTSSGWDLIVQNRGPSQRRRGEIIGQIGGQSSLGPLDARLVRVHAIGSLSLLRSNCSSP